MQRSRLDRVVDLVLGEPELLAGALIAQRCTLAPPFEAVEKASSALELRAVTRAVLPSGDTATRTGGNRRKREPALIRGSSRVGFPLISQPWNLVD